MTDQFIGNYRVIDKIGAGGMAKVYLGVHKDIPNLRVVLKILSNPGLIDRFKQEADKLAILDGHPNICRIKDFFNHGDETVIAMEYIDGQTLDEKLKTDGRMPIKEALKIAHQVLDILEFAHQHGIYHRDIKPSNIMIDKSGQVKIIDFGIAKAESDPNLTTAGAMCGTPAYMAPEQFTQSFEFGLALVDVYALGTTLFRMITGELPFKSDNEFILRDAKLSTEPPSPRSLNSGVSKELDRLILKAMDKDPHKRFQSAAEMAAAVVSIIKSDASPIETTRDSVKPRTPAHAKKRSKGLMYGVGAAVVLIVVAAAYIFLPSKGTDTSGRVALLSPGGGQTIADTDMPLLTWSLTEGQASSFTLEYATDSAFVSPVTIPALTSPEYRFTAKLANGPYYWRVRALDAEGRSGDYSPTASFVVALAPAAATTGQLTITASPSGEIFVDSRPAGSDNAVITLEPGLHAIRVDNAQSVEKTIRDSVTVVAGQSAERSYRFTASVPTVPKPASPQARFGEARVGSRPRGAIVYIDGERQRQETNFTFKLKTGTHIVRAVLAIDGQERELSDTIVVVADSSQRVFFDFEQ
jgi:serine/threonine protein kinase